MKMAQKTNAHRLLPTKWINNIDHLALFAFGTGIKKRIALYKRYLSDRNPEYLNWSIDCLVHCDQIKTPKYLKVAFSILLHQEKKEQLLLMVLKLPQLT